MPDDEAADGQEYSEDGVDLGLIRWMLSLSPSERLAYMQDLVNDIRAIQALNPHLLGGQAPE